jgi:hypothetical protein
MSNDFHAVKALRRGECGPLWAPRRARVPTRGLRAGHHEEYAASVRRAFTPLGCGLVALACQWPATSPSQTTLSLKAGSRAAAGPCFESSAPADPASASSVPGSVAASFELPERAGDFCLDRWAPPSGYGEGASQSLERACERVLGPSCRGEERVGLQRVVRFHYVQAQDPASGVDGVLSRFEDALGAYAHFTHAVVGDGDPADLTATALDESRLVQRGDSLFAWRGREVLWLRHADERQTAAQRAQAALAALPPLARSVLDLLGDSSALPAAVQRLPDAGRVPLGVRVLLGDAFGVAGLGPSARGYYRQGKQRWRVVALVRADAEGAEDVMSTLEEQPDARRIENAPLDALKLTERRSAFEPQLGWVIGRRAEVVVGIGDEETALPESAAGRRDADVELTLQEKLSKLLEAHGR